MLQKASRRLVRGLRGEGLLELASFGRVCRFRCPVAGRVVLLLPALFFLRWKTDSRPLCFFLGSAEVSVPEDVVCAGSHSCVRDSSCAHAEDCRGFAAHISFSFAFLVRALELPGRPGRHVRVPL